MSLPTILKRNNSPIKLSISISNSDCKSYWIKILNLQLSFEKSKTNVLTMNSSLLKSLSPLLILYHDLCSNLVFLSRISPFHSISITSSAFEAQKVQRRKKKVPEPSCKTIPNACEDLNHQYFLQSLQRLLQLRASSHHLLYAPS